jgi:hypothetical protein
MAVVINEFEVVPAESRPAQSERAAAEPVAARPPKDPERELERMLRKKQARAARLMAV